MTEISSANGGIQAFVDVIADVTVASVSGITYASRNSVEIDTLAIRRTRYRFGIKSTIDTLGKYFTVIAEPCRIS